MKDRSVHPIGRETNFHHQGMREIATILSIAAPFGHMAASIIDQQRFLYDLQRREARVHRSNCILKYHLDARSKRKQVARIQLRDIGPLNEDLSRVRPFQAAWTSRHGT